MAACSGSRRRILPNDPERLQHAVGRLALGHDQDATGLAATHCDHGAFGAQAKAAGFEDAEITSSACFPQSVPQDIAQAVPALVAIPALEFSAALTAQNDEILPGRLTGADLAEFIRIRGVFGFLAHFARVGCRPACVNTAWNPYLARMQQEPARVPGIARLA